MNTTDDNFILNPSLFFNGIVEERNDPLKLGRVKVRIFGLHDDNFSVLNPDDLPWALILIPTTESGVSGIGTSKGGIPPGTWVFGTYLDGENKQQPLILGSIQGKPSKPEESSSAYKSTNSKEDENNFKREEELGVDLTKGFFDQNEEFLSGYPRPSYSSSSEQDHNRLSRSESLDQTIEKLKQLDNEQNIKIAIDRNEESAQTWEELNSGRETLYPYNTVNETESGIITERDDTPYTERFHSYFSPGHSYTEIGLQGTGYNFQKTWGDSISVKFSPQEKYFVRGRVDENKDGDVTEQFGKTKTVEIYDTETKYVYDSIKIRACGQINTFAGGDYILMANNNCRFSINNKMDFDISGKYRESFHDTHHTVYWMRKYTWNEGQEHVRRKRNYFEKNNETYHSIVIENRRDLIAVGDKDLTIGANYKLSIGACPDGSGDWHITVNGNQVHYIKKNYDLDVLQQKAERVKEDVHYTYLSNQLQLTAKNKDVTIGQNYTKVVLENEEKKIGGNNRVLVRGNRDIAVEQSQQLEVGQTFKRMMLVNDEEQVQKDKVLYVENWFYKKINNGLNKIGVWWHDTGLKNIIGTLEQAWIKRRDHLYENMATHILKKMSLKINEDCNIVIDGDVGVHIKGELLLRVDKDFIVSIPEESFVLGAKKNVILGSKLGDMMVKAPNLIETDDDIVIPAEIGEYEPPDITIDYIDLSNLQNDLVSPEIPTINVDVNKVLDNEKPLGPEEPTLPDLPEKSKIGEFVNTRTQWSEDDTISKNNDQSSLG